LWWLIKQVFPSGYYKQCSVVIISTFYSCQSEKIKLVDAADRKVLRNRQISGTVVDSAIKVAKK